MIGELCCERLAGNQAIAGMSHTCLNELVFGGFAAAHGGKPLAFRRIQFSMWRLCLHLVKRRSLINYSGPPSGKPEAYRHVLRQSRNLRALLICLPKL